jgi:hypothetical protein
VHGEPQASAALEARLVDQGASRVIRPSYGQKIDLAN